MAWGDHVPGFVLCQCPSCYVIGPGTWVDPEFYNRQVARMLKTLQLRPAPDYWGYC